MKRTLICIFCVLHFLTYPANGQSEVQNNRQPTLSYGSADFLFGNHIGFDLSYNAVFRDLISFQVGFTTLSRRAKELPSDFEPRLFDWVAPRDNAQHLKSAAGISFKLSANNNSPRINLLAGVSYTVLNEAVNFRSTGWNYVLPDYDYEQKRTATVSGIFVQKIEIPLAPKFGMNVGTEFLYNKHTVAFGVGLGVSFGRISTYSPGK